MYELPFKPNEFDLFWAEGSIYNIGFERGLTEWRKFIKPNGFIAVSDCSWLTNVRPKEDANYFAENFKEIDSITNKLQIMTDAGYMPVAHFILPEYCWFDNYYTPIRNCMPAFLEENNNSEEAKLFVDRMNKERAMYQQYKSCHGYVFYIGQKVD
jgi:SAM-dependent methyltransferase